jgi:hypothetical protein
MSDLLLQFRLSGASSHSGVQTDPELSLGNYASSTYLDEDRGTLTSNMTLKDRFIDTVRIGDGVDIHADSWILFADGTNEFQAQRIRSFDSVTGEFVLDGKFSTLALSGDTYKLFAPGNLFLDLTPEKSVDAPTRHRTLFVGRSAGNSSGKMYVINYDSGPFSHKIMLDYTFKTPAYQMVNEEAEPDFSDSLLTNTKKVSEGWLAPYSYETAIPSWTNMTSAYSTQFPPFLVRQEVISPVYPRATSCAVGIFYDNDAGVSGGFLIVNSPAGIAGQIAVEQDRKTVIGGGCKLVGSFTAQDGTPLPVTNMDWTIVSGGGSIDYDEDVADEDGQQTCRYTAPTDPAYGDTTAVIKVST